MTCTTSHRGLAAAAKAATTSANRRPAVAALGHLRLWAADGRLSVRGGFAGFGDAVTTATTDADGDLALVAITPDSLAAALKALAAGEDRKHLDQAVVELSAGPDGELLLTTDGHRAIARPARTGLDLPAEVEPAPTVHAVVDRAQLLEALARVDACTCRDTTLPRFMFCKATTTDGTLSLVGTDRYRITRQQVPATATTPGAVNLPTRAALAALKAANGTGQQVQVGTCQVEGRTEAWLAIGDDWTWHATQHDQPLPDLGTVTGRGSTSFTVERAHLARALAKAAATCERNAPVHVDLADGRLLVTGGSLVEAPGLPVRHLSGDQSVLLDLNPHYMADALNGTSGDMLLMSTNGTGKPVRFEDADGDGGTFNVVMSMRTSR